MRREWLRGWQRHLGTVVILGHVECWQGQKVLDLYLEKFYIREMYPVPVTFMGRWGLLHMRVKRVEEQD
jgi:hypothetical protein